MDIRPCEGVRSPTNPERPAAICRDCKCRIAWQRGERDGMLIPLAYEHHKDSRRLLCVNKPRY